MGSAVDIHRVELNQANSSDHLSKVPCIDTTVGATLGEALCPQGVSAGLINRESSHRTRTLPGVASSSS